MKIVGIGLNKTGTTSLGRAMEYLGYKHHFYSLESFNLFKEKKLDELMSIVEAYDSFEDWPWPMIYQDIDRAIPEAKFILTTRSSPEAWYQSLCNHAERLGTYYIDDLIYGYSVPRNYPEEHLQFYREHNAAARSYFRDRPGKLLEVSWDRGDGWTELANFLGHDVPDVPFPHANKKPNLFKKARKKIKRTKERLQGL